MDYKDYIETINDYPIKGIQYRDIQPLLKNNSAFKYAIKGLGELVDWGTPDYWVGIESRGFIIAAALSMEFGGGIKLIRKKGKLPNERKFSVGYGLEYGKDELEIHNDNEVGKRVVIVDDVYATGGTMEAAEKLCRAVGYEVIDRIALIDIGIVKEHNIKSIIKY